MYFLGAVITIWLWGVWIYSYLRYLVNINRYNKFLTLSSFLIPFYSISFSVLYFLYAELKHCNKISVVSALSISVSMVAGSSLIFIIGIFFIAIIINNSKKTLRESVAKYN